MDAHADKHIGLRVRATVAEVLATDPVLIQGRGLDMAEQWNPVHIKCGCILTGRMCPTHYAAPKLLEALGELLLGGAHDGRCDNEGYQEEEPCRLHIARTAAREALAQRALALARAEPSVTA